MSATAHSSVPTLTGTGRPATLTGSASPSLRRRLKQPGTSLEPNRVCEANAGDHGEVHQLLTAVFQAPSREAYLGSLEDPFYEPPHRILVRRGLRTIAHVHVTAREMEFDGQRIPVGCVSWLATLPEFRSQGCGRLLMDAAERRLADDGALLGMLQTKIPHYFRARGWAVCGRHSYSRAGARDVLAEMSRQSNRLKSRPLTIRPWRQVELPSLMRIYRQNAQHGVGPWHRSEEYWRWLITRNSSIQFWVAIEGPDKLELDHGEAPIVGYMITRDDHVLEIMSEPGHPTARLLLLSRACGEAIERDCHGVTVHAPSYDPVHAICTAAGGVHHHHESDQGLVSMVKLLEPARFLRQLRPVLRQRALTAKLSLPLELGLAVEGQKYRLRVTRRGVKLLRDKLGRSYLNLNVAEFTRLLLGHLDLEQAIGQGRLEASTRVAIDTAAALFPRLPLWRSPLDDGIATM